jgi:hypothetical protein
LHNEARTHLSLYKDAPIPREVQRFGQIFAKPRECGRVRQRVVANLGPCGSVVEARWRLGTEASPIAGFI